MRIIELLTYLNEVQQSEQNKVLVPRHLPKECRPGDAGLGCQLSLSVQQMRIMHGSLLTNNIEPGAIEYV